MAEVAPVPLSFMVPPLTDASAAADGETSASTQSLLGSFRQGALALL